MPAVAARSRTIPSVATAAVVAAVIAALPERATASPPPGDAVVFEEHAINEPFSSEENWPCLGEAGGEGDLATITGVETRHITVTAAGVDESGFVAPFTIRATEHMRVMIDPVGDGLPTYEGGASSVFRERVREPGHVVLSNALFRATATDGSGALKFRFRLLLVVDPKGEVHVDRLFADCTLT